MSPRAVGARLRRPWGLLAQLAQQGGGLQAVQVEHGLPIQLEGAAHRRMIPSGQAVVRLGVRCAHVERLLTWRLLLARRSV